MASDVAAPFKLSKVGISGAKYGGLAAAGAAISAAIGLTAWLKVHAPGYEDAGGVIVTFVLATAQNWFRNRNRPLA